MKIMTAMQVKLTVGERARVFEKGTDNLQAYIKAMRGWAQFGGLNRDDNLVARQLAREAIEIDPQFPNAYTLLAWTHLMDVWFGWGKSRAKSLETASELALKAIIRDDRDASAHGLLGHVYLMKRQHYHKKTSL